MILATNTLMIGLLCILFISLLYLTGYVGNVVRADALSDDEAAIAANIKDLHSEKSDVRESAAKDLRRIIAKYPSGTSNIRSKDGGEGYWTEKVNQIVPGMTAAEVVKILPLFAEFPENSGVGSGDSHITGYRLDNNWLVSIQYRNPDKVIERPKLIKREFSVYVAPPKNYTGTWICWYVNGQKGYEIQFRDGKYDGVFIRFHDNGRKWTEQYHTDHQADGAGSGWYPDGKISYTIQYKNGKQDGQWIHWYPNGTKSSEFNYKNGVNDGLHAGWYENGQMRYEMNYVNGIQDGVEAAWNEQGILQYKRECKNGKVVP